MSRLSQIQRLQWLPAALAALAATAGIGACNKHIPAASHQKHQTGRRSD